LLVELLRSRSPLKFRVAPSLGNSDLRTLLRDVVSSFVASVTLVPLLAHLLQLPISDRQDITPMVEKLQRE
jgi:hypothetical protein